MENLRKSLWFIIDYMSLCSFMSNFLSGQTQIYNFRNFWEFCSRGQSSIINSDQTHCHIYSCKWLLWFFYNTFQTTFSTGPIWLTIQRHGYPRSPNCLSSFDQGRENLVNLDIKKMKCPLSTRHNFLNNYPLFFNYTQLTCFSRSTLLGFPLPRIFTGNLI